MKVRYDKLWRLMKDNKMKKSDLAKAAELSPYTMTKLNKDRPVNMEVMMNLCKVFHCDIGDLTGGYPVLFTVEILMANVMTICWTL